MKISPDSFVILTGASSGIGLCLAKELINRYHCRVLGIARSKEKLQKAAGQFGSSFEYRAFDIQNEQAWRQLQTELLHRQQPVDLLIHCAGIMPPFMAAKQYTSQQLQTVMNINFMGSVNGFQAMLPALLLAQNPAILVVASAGGLAPLAGTSAYAASKAAEKAYFQALREEWRGKIQITIACPGLVNTDLFRNHSIPESEQKLMHMIGANPDTIAKRMLKALKQGKGTVPMGADGHLLSAGMRLCPNFTLRVCRRVMQQTGLILFHDIFYQNQ